MTQDNDIRRCIETLDRIEEQVCCIDDKLDEISTDPRDNLQAMRERDFWKEYDRYANRGI